MFRQIINSQDNVILFGQYKSKTVREVIAKNAQYLLWLADEKVIKIADDALELYIIEVASEQYKKFLRDKQDDTGLNDDWGDRD